MDHPALTAERETAFHGWRIIYAGMVLMFISSGIGYHCNAVILDPLRDLHGWNKGTISAALTLYFVVVGLAGIVVGKKVDELGSRPVLVFGSIVNGMGLIFLSLIHEVWQLFITYAVMAVGFACTSQIAISAVITNWFVKKRGAAFSIAMTGISLGGIVIVPMASFAVSFWGVDAALEFLGISLCAVMIPVTLLFIRQHPAEVGQFPDGDASPGTVSAGCRNTAEAFGQLRRWTYGEVLRTLPFWSIVVTFLLAMGSIIAIGMHQISFLSQFVGANSAAFMVSIMTGASLAGRLVIGKIIDKYDKRAVFIGILLCQASSVLVLAFFHQTLVLYICTMILGLTLGSVLMAQSLLIGECFGMISFGMVYGLASLFIQCGAAFGPLIGGLIFDATQSYRNAFIIFAGASALASVTVVFARRPDRISN